MAAPFLFELVLKATLVILGAWAVACLLSRASAAARSAVWAAALTFIVVLPLCMALAPAWSLEVLPFSPVRRAVEAIDEPLAHRELPQSSTAALTMRVPARALPTAAGAATVAWSVLLALWLFGTFMALARVGRGLMIIRSICRAAEPLADPEWAAVVAQGCAYLGLRRPPKLSISSRMAIPAVTGVVKPTLVLPSDCSRWSDSCRRAVVLHELAHLKRRDCLIQLLADCACAIYWFHPLVHRAISQLRHEREQACDDVVIAAGTSPTKYADHLLDLVRSGLTVPPAAAVAFGTPSRLNHRISAILDDDRCRTAPPRRTVAAAVLAGVVVVATLGGAHLEAQATPAGHDPTHGGGIVVHVITADTRQRVGEALVVALRDGSDDVRKVAASAIDAIRASGDASLRVETPCRGNCVTWPAVSSVAQLLNDVRCRWLNGPLCDLVDLLESSDPEVRRAAVGRVWPRTPRGAAALTKALLDDDRIVRNGAAIRLDSVHAPIAVPNWIILLGDADPMLRERAAISLGVIVDARAVEPLGNALRDPETAVRLQAATALASIALGPEGTRSTS